MVRGDYSTQSRRTGLFASGFSPKPLKGLRKVRRAFATRRKLRASVRLSVKDTLGRTTTTVKTMTLKR